MIGIIFVNDICYSPYIEKYIHILKNHNCEYEFIIWNRFSQKNTNYRGNNFNIFNYELDDETKISNKLFAFFKYRKYVKTIITQKKYDKLIILTTMTGILLLDILLAKYRKRYIFDYRDASFEYIPGFKVLLKILAKNSSFTCISSKGFEKIIPKKIHYVMAHNFRYKDIQYQNNYIKPINPNETINVACVGNLRGNDYIRKLIDLFSKDSRFLLYICGGGGNLKKTEEYANKFENIVCTGPYDNNDKKNYINNAHVLCYNYPSSFINDNAIANKYYDSLIYKKPMLGNKKTYSGQLIEKNGLGICLDFDEKNFTNKLFDYLCTIDPSSFLENSNKLLQKVLKEDQIYLEMISDFIKECK